jgi:hypothetical protein
MPGKVLTGFTEEMAFELHDEDKDSQLERKWKEPQKQKNSISWSCNSEVEPCLASTGSGFCPQNPPPSKK